MLLGQRRQLCGGVQWLAIEQQAAAAQCMGAMLPGQGFEQGGLAGAARAHQHSHPGATDGQGDPGKNRARAELDAPIDKINLP